MATTTPPTVEKVCVDIDFSGGVNEDDTVESIDWTKNLSTAENVVYNQGKKLSVRNGLNAIGAVDDTSTSITPIYRLASLDNGVGILGSGFNFYQVNDSRANISKKSQHSEFSVSSRQLSSANPGYVKSVYLTDNYECILHQSTVANAGQHVLVIADRKSGNVVRSYLYSNTASSNVSMVGVGGRYLHFYVYDTTASPKMFQVDTLNLPTVVTGIGTSTVNLTGGVATSVIRGIISDSSTTSVVMYENAAGTTRFERFNTTPASAATGSLVVANLTNYDIDWSSSNSHYYIVGILTGAPNRYQLRELDTSFAATRTVTDTTAVTADLSTDNIRVTVNPSTGEVRAVAWAALSIASASMGAVSVPYCQVYSCTSAATTFTLLGFLSGWMELGLPFYLAGTSKFYIPVQKFVPGVIANPSGTTSGFFSNASTSSMAAVLVDITAAMGPTNVAPRVFRPAAVLDHYVGNQAQYTVTTGKFTGLIPQRPSIDTTLNVVMVGCTSRSLYSSVSIESSLAKWYDPSNVVCATNVLSGGMTGKYDGNAVSEIGFVDVPMALTDQDGVLAVPAGATAANFKYTLVYEYRDNDGRVHFSPSMTSGTAGARGDNNGTNFHTLVCTVSAHQATYGAPGIFITAFRSSGANAVYYRAASVAQSTTISTATTELLQDVNQRTSDTTIVSQPLMYRQPGAPGTPLDRFPAISSQTCVRNKERIFTAKDKTVYYSSFAVDGEQEWFNPSLSFPVSGGYGPITGLGTIDGTLVVLKRDSVFLIDGDGPPENGGNGTEFSTPRKLSSEFGCIDPRSVVQVPNGLMFRSTRGIELLNRTGQLAFIGRTVFNTVNANPYTSGACFDRNFARAYFCIAATQPANNIVGTSSGVVLCYDFLVSAWTVHKYSQNSGFGFAMQDMVFAKSPITIASLDVESLFLTDGSVFYSENPITQRDYPNAHIPVRVDTGWIRAPQSMQERIKSTDLFVLGNNQSPHNLVVSYAANWNPTFTSVKTFADAATTGLVPQQVNVSSPREEVQSLRWRIETAAPTSGTVGNGKQLDITGITVRVGIRGGGAKLAATQKG